MLVSAYQILEKFDFYLNYIGVIALIYCQIL